MLLDKYIGLPYSQNGRTKDGIDCWGLVRLYYEQERNILLPSYEDEYSGAIDPSITQAINTHKDNWMLTTSPEIGDVVVFNIAGEPAHVGIYIGGNKFLHSREGKDSVVESLSNAKWQKRIEGIYTYAPKTALTINGMPHPLKTALHSDLVVDGSTVQALADFLETKYSISKKLADKINIMVDGVIIPKSEWSTTILNKDQVISYKAVPEGREGLRLVLSIAVIAASAGFGELVGEALLGDLVGAKTATMVGSMVINIAGMALINKIFPVRPPDIRDPGSAKAVNLFTGASNSANRFGAIPVVLGKVRATALLGATPYVETLTDTSVLNLLLVWGFGPLEISDVCIGTNPIDSYYEYGGSTTYTQSVPKPVHLQGLPSENTAEFDHLYAKDVEQHFPNIELINNPNITNGNPSAEITFSQKSSAIDIGLTFPEGMRQLVVSGEQAGKVNMAKAGVEILVAKVGTNDWGSTSNYFIGDTGTATSNASAFSTVLLPAYFSYTATLGYENDISLVPLYRWTIFAMQPGGGIVQFDGAASETIDGEPSATLIAAYKAGSYATLSGKDPKFKRLPTIPANYLKIHAVCIYGKSGIAQSISYLSGYSSYQGLALTTEALGDYMPNAEGMELVNTGSIKVNIATGKIYQQTANQPGPGVTQTVFNSRSFSSSQAVTNNAWSSFMNTCAVWNSGNTGITFDKTKAVTFPWVGYYVVEVGIDDEGAVYIDDAKILDVPKDGYKSSAKTVYYIEEPNTTLDVRITANNSGGYAAGVACIISYTANSGLNVLASSSTELTFGTDGFFSYRKDAFNFVYRIRGLDPNYAYKVRVRRTTDDVTEPATDLRNYNKVIFYSATAYDNTAPMKNPPGVYLARSAIRVQSTNKVNGTIEGVNAIVQTKCPDWDATTNKWVFRATNNPASLFLYILTHPANAYRIAAEDVSSQIDLVKLQEWHVFCNTITSYKPVKLTYNNVITNTISVMDALRDVAAAGMASPTFIDGKWSVIIDAPRSTVVQHFTPHNSWGFEGTKLLPKIPDCFRVTIPDEENAYQAKEVRVCNYGFSETGAAGTIPPEVFEEINLPGVTNTAQAEFFAKWHLAQLKLRPETYTLNVDFEYLVCTRGDVVKVTHDVPLWGTGSGRIKSINGTTIGLTDDIYLTAGKTYNISVRTNTGASITKTLSSITTSGYVNTITLTTAFTTAEGVEVDNLFMLGEVNKVSQQLIVLSIEPTDTYSAKLTLTDYSPEMYSLNLSQNYTYNSNITINNVEVIQNTINSSPTITTVVSDSYNSEQISTGIYKNILRVAYANAANITKNATKVQLQILAGNMLFEESSLQGLYTVDKDAASITVDGLISGTIYKLRIRYSNSTGSICGPWSDTLYTTVIGKTKNDYTVPSITLDLEYTDIVASLPTGLTKPTNFKCYEYRLYKDTGTEDFWELDTTSNNILVTQTLVEGRFNLLNVPAPRMSSSGITYRVACRALDNNNNYSPASALGTIVIKTIT